MGEIIDGELSTPIWMCRSGRVAAVPGGWWFLVEPELHVGGHVVIPDIADWRRDRVPFIPDTPGISVVPDWVCEGVDWLWFVDPLARLVELYARRGDEWLVGGDLVAPAAR